MKNPLREVIQSFCELLAEISMEEIISNRELSLRAQLLNHLLLKMKES